METTREQKKTAYNLLEKQLQALIQDEREPIPNLANASALLFGGLPLLNWVGFYLNTGTELLLGPFQGRPACIRIPFSRGVCGAAARELKTQRVRDVHEFPGHIACDDASRSELVVPMVVQGRLVAVLDADSPVADRFDEMDQEGMERLAELLCRGCRW